MADDTQYGQSAPVCNLRSDVIAARQAQMLAIQRAVAGGISIAELRHDAGTFADGVQRMLDVLGTPGVDAPMVLAKA